MSDRQGPPYVEIGHRIADFRKALGRRRGRRVSQREVAEYIPVHEGTVTAWELGKQKPEGGNLVRLAEFLETTPDEIVGHAVSTPGQAFIIHRAASPQPDGATEKEALELFGNFDDVVRHLRGVAPPGQSQARKLAAVEGIERAAVSLGWTLPDWFFDLRRQINEGEL